MSFEIKCDVYTRYYELALKNKGLAGGVAQWQSASYNTGFLSPVAHKPGTVTHAFHPSTLIVEVGRSIS